MVQTTVRPGTTPGRSTRTADARDDVPVLGLRNYWYPAATSSELGKKPLGVKLLGEDIVLFRSRDKVYALSDGCAHKGTPLSIGSSKFPGTITCAYHGWTYDRHGVCVAALNEGPDSKLPGKPRIPTYPAEERAGMIWVYVGDVPPPPVEADIPPELFSKDQVLFPLVFTWKTNWRYVMENVCDTSHSRFVHRYSIRNWFRKIWQISRLHVSDNEEGNGFYISPANVEVEVAGTEFPGVGVFPASNWWRFQQVQLKPTTDRRAVLEIRLPGWLRTNAQVWFFIQWSVPIDATTSKQYCWLRRPVKDRLDTVYGHLYWNSQYKYLMTQFFGQDKVVCEAQERVNAFARPEKLSVSDTGVIRWRKLVTQARGSEHASPVVSTSSNGHQNGNAR